MKLTVVLNKAELVSKIKKHLAIIAKRARDREGKSIFSEITTSTTEDYIYEDMISFGVNDMVARLKDLCSVYVNDGENITFDMYSDRWKIEKTEIEIEDEVDVATMDLINNLTESITNFVFNFAVARYLNSISPAVGKYSDAYIENSNNILNTLVEFAFVRRAIRVPEYPYTKEIVTYGDTIELKKGEKASVTYDIDYGKEDDIEVRFMPQIVRLRGKRRCQFDIMPILKGKCCMTLYSKHNSDVFKHLELKITD